jgi:hypothetical protein
MITKKLWTLSKPDATQSDSTFLFGLGCSIEVVVPEPIEFIAPTGSRWKFTYTPENPYIKIETTCEKQEMMLKLKYGDELRLQQVYHTTPETITSFPDYEDFNMASHSRSTA